MGAGVPGVCLFPAVAMAGRVAGPPRLRELPAGGSCSACVGGTTPCACEAEEWRWTWPGARGNPREGKLGEAVGVVPPGAAPGPPGFLRWTSVPE